VCEIRFGLFIGRGEGDPARIPNNFERTERSSGGVRSECVIPRPAVIQLSSPGRIGSHLSLRGWQRPPHGKAAEIPRAGDDDYVNRVTGECFTRLRIDGRLPAHIHLTTTRWFASWRLQWPAHHENHQCPLWGHVTCRALQIEHWIIL